MTNKPKLLFLQGLPASGKTTYAKTLEAQGWVRVNKDDIREELTKNGWVWSPEKEQEVLTIRDLRVIAALKKGLNTISDDTNFARKHKVRLEDLARMCGAEFEPKRFDLPLDECLERNRARGGNVPDDAITKMYHQYVREDGVRYPVSSEPTKVERVPLSHDPTLQSIILCDLDGTLALFGDKRGPYDASKCADDDLNLPVAETVRAMQQAGYPTVFMSGREEIYQEQTKQFLDKHGLDGLLFMRHKGDRRKDCIVKGELIEAHIRGKYNVLFCLDDRQQVVDFYRSLGLTVFQVAPGQF